MKKKMIFSTIGLITASLLFLMPVYAQENVEDLKKQIEALQKRVEELESNKIQEQNNGSWDFFNHRGNRGWDPFFEMERMQEEMNRMFNNSFSNRGWSRGGTFSNQLSFNSDFDFKETKDGYEIRFDLTGLNKDKFDIEINEHSITVKGEHSRQDTEEGPNRYFSTQSYGSFMKTIPLPVDADTEKMKTEKEGDSLVITMPKKTA